jgi:translation initiation factor 6
MLKTTFEGDPNIGLYGFATEKHLVSPFTGKMKKKLEKTLKVKAVNAIIMNTYFAGIFLAGNSSGIVASSFIQDYGHTKIDSDNVLYLKTKHTAIGNMILLNDNGGVISPTLKRYKKDIEDFLGVKTTISTIAGLRIPGSAAIANKNGCIVHPKVKDKELELIEKALDVPVKVGTVNYGSPYVKSGIILNSRDFAASTQSTGPELGNIVESLGFL